MAKGRRKGAQAVWSTVNKLPNSENSILFRFVRTPQIYFISRTYRFFFPFPIPHLKILDFSSSPPISHRHRSAISCNLDSLLLLVELRLLHRWLEDLE